MATTRSSMKRLPEKAFISRESPLTLKLQTKPGRLIHLVAIGFIFLWLAKITACDGDDCSWKAMENNLRTWRDFARSSMENSAIAFLVWLKLAALSLLAYPITIALAKFDEHVPTSFRYFFILPAYLFHQFVIAKMAFQALFADDSGHIGAAASALIASEQVRLQMKFHSFFREVFKIQQAAGGAKTKKSGTIPTFTSYIYFLFAPTLVYRTKYPRKRSRNWSLIIFNFVEFAIAAFCVFIVFQRYLSPNFGTFPTPQQLDFKTFSSSVVGYILPSMGFLFFGYYGFFQLWLNAWAELLRFSDRQFYGDWWNTKTVAEFARSWNLVVHGWFYTYIYKDIRDTWPVSKLAKIAAPCLVFACSSIIHQYVIDAMTKFYFPFPHFLFFCLIGFPLTFINQFAPSGSDVPSFSSRIYLTFNQFVIITAMFVPGQAICQALYSYEASALNSSNLCPTMPSLDLEKNDDYFDFFVEFLCLLLPRFWWCIESNN